MNLFYLVIGSPFGTDRGTTPEKKRSVDPQAASKVAKKARMAPQPAQIYCMIKDLVIHLAKSVVHDKVDKKQGVGLSDELEGKQDVFDVVYGSTPDISGDELSGSNYSPKSGNTSSSFDELTKEVAQKIDREK